MQEGRIPSGLRSDEQAAYLQEHGFRRERALSNGGEVWKHEANPSAVVHLFPDMAREAWCKVAKKVQRCSGEDADKALVDSWTQSGVFVKKGESLSSEPPIYYVGLDVWGDETRICVVNKAGDIVDQGSTRTDVGDIYEWLDECTQDGRIVGTGLRITYPHPEARTLASELAALELKVTWSESGKGCVDDIEMLDGEDVDIDASGALTVAYLTRANKTSSKPRALNNKPAGRGSSPHL